jgi:hypothetical protein
VRDVIQPQRDLGHSDRKGHKAVDSEEAAKVLNTPDVEGEEKTVDPERRGSVAQFREVVEQACEDCQ